jgi:hypothetical protein
MMKILMRCVLLAMVVCACNDNRFPEINSLPTLSITNKNGELLALDSMKTSLKNGSRFYELRLSVEDEDKNIQEIRYDIMEGRVNVLQDNATLEGRIFDEPDGINLKIEPLEPGRIEIRFEVNDEFGESVTGIFILVAFDNLIPEGRLESRKIGALGDLDYEIDASNSFDLDERFGGGIERYEYVIDDVTIETRLNKLRHNFRQVGFYVIRLRVQDNDGAWSTVHSREFLID